MAVFRIPLQSTPQKFAIDLNAKPYIMTCVWNGEHDSWEISLFNGDTEEPIFAGLPLVTGVDLLAQYGYHEIGGELIVYTDGEEHATPTLTNLGQESNLYYLV
jgi:hypothetical protein